MLLRNEIRVGGIYAIEYSHNKRGKKGRRTKVVKLHDFDVYASTVECVNTSEIKHYSSAALITMERVHEIIKFINTCDIPDTESELKELIDIKKYYTEVEEIYNRYNASEMRRKVESRVNRGYTPAFYVKNGIVFNEIDVDRFEKPIILSVPENIRNNKDMTTTIYGDGLFISVGCGGVIAISEDGLNWRNGQSDDGVVYCGESTFDLYNVKYNHAHGLYIAVGSEGKILTSADGEVWNTQQSPVNKALSDVIFSNNMYVAVGESGTIITSPNGIDWTKKRSKTSASLLSICYAFMGGLFVAVGTNRTIVTSYDGDKWIKVEENIYRTLYHIDHFNGHFIAVGNKGTILSSIDGEIWENDFLQYPYDLVYITHIDDIAIVVNSVGEIYLSTEGFYNWKLWRKTDYNITNVILQNDKIYLCTSGNPMYN